MSSTATSADLTEVGRTQDQLTHSSSPHATGSCVESRHGEGSAAPRQPLPEGLVVEDQWSRDQELRSNIVSLANAVQRLSSEIEKLSSQRSSTQLCPRTSVVGPEGVVVDEESGVIDSSLSIGTSNDRDHNTEALTAFWNAQSPSDEKLVELRNVFIDVVYGPRRDIKGIRDCFDPSINDDNSPTFLVFRETDEKAGTIWRSVSWEPVEVEDDNPDTWDKFSKEISNNIKEKWLYSFGGKARAGSPQDPTHFSDGWDHFQGASVILTELSYNEQCFPKRVHSKSWQGGAFISEKSLKAVDSSPVQLQPTWGKKIFGKSWRVSFEDTVLNFTLLAFILSQVTLGYNIDTEDIGFCGAVFAKRYAGPWPSTKWARWCCFGNDNRICHLQFHIRYISTSNTAIARLIPEVLSEGLHFHREKGQAFSLGAGQDFPLVESRVAIAINTSLDSKFAHYSMVTLTDSDKLSLDDFEGNQAWSDINFSLCGKFAGVAVFQVAIRRLLMVWGRRWNFVLDSINNLLKVQIDDILDPTERRKLTFDSSFQQSELHFAILQLLRISFEWIREAMDDFKSLEEDFNGSTAQIAPEVVRSNWKALVSCQDIIGRRLLERIEKKTNEIESLRNGICLSRYDSKAAVPQGISPPDFNSELEFQSHPGLFQGGFMQTPHQSLKLSHGIPRLVVIVSVWSSAVLSHITDFFLGTALPQDTTRLRWTCRCGHTSYDDFSELSSSGIEKMTNELNKSGFITAVSIDTTTGGAIGGMGNFVSALRHGVQSLMSPSQSQSDLPTAEPQTAVVGEHSHQPRPGCKFLHICVGKRQYSTRMDHIDICEKRTDRAIFHTLRRHYKEVRRELIGILFKVRRIDFVKFQMGPNGLVYSLVPDQLPPPPPDNLEYEYFPAPPQTRPPICPRFMAHLWHCKEEVPEQNFFCKRFPKKKDTPCIFTSDNEPTANLGWGLHIVEVFNISLIVWILFGFTAISGLIFSISWTLLRDDISGAYAVASYITALTALLLMAITTTIAS